MTDRSWKYYTLRLRFKDDVRTAHVKSRTGLDRLASNLRAGRDIDQYEGKKKHSTIKRENIVGIEISKFAPPILDASLFTEIRTGEKSCTTSK